MPVDGLYFRTALRNRLQRERKVRKREKRAERTRLLRAELYYWETQGVGEKRREITEKERRTLSSRSSYGPSSKNDRAKKGVPAQRKRGRERSERLWNWRRENLRRLGY